MEKQRIPCCYHPTTVLLVDDNYKYLCTLQLGLNSQAISYKLFDDPIKALKFIEDNYHPSSFINRYIQEDLLHERRILDVNVRAIHQEIYNPKRFCEIGGIVVDFVMPSISGLELCQKIKDKLFKRILLTGEDQEKKAIQGFNNGDIHQFIRKDDTDFIRVINQAIERSQWQYFLDQSSVITNTIAENSQLKILSDPNFIQLFNHIRQKTNNTEFYLLDKQGSFLLLDREAKPSWLIVKSEQEMVKLYEYARDEEAPEEVISAIKERRMLPYFHSDSDLQTHPSNWQPYLFPATLLKGEQLYYYAFLTDEAVIQLKRDQILSYEVYLNSL